MRGAPDDTSPDAVGDAARLVEWNATAVAYPLDRTMHSLIEEQVRRTPSGTAVILEGNRLSYEELNRRANRLARHLVRLGVGPEVLVGICLERSLELVVGLLAILKAGGAYVPLDPSYPQDRLAYMLADAQAPVLLTHSTLRDRLPASPCSVVCLDTAAAGPWDTESSEDGAGACHAGNAAYVIYTSGSTGRPKGAVNEHRGLVNRILWSQDALKLGADDRVLQKTPVSFDVSVWEFFWPLATGAAIVLCRPGGHRDPAYLAALLERERVTTLHFVPPMLRAFLDAGFAFPASVRRVLCSGESLPGDLQRAFHARSAATLYNLYGPTEAAIDVTWWVCARDDMRATVPIGRPVANTQMHVLDADRRPVPIGEPGELYIGGVQVGRGYLRRPEVTAERFVPDPFREEPEARLYRTGDLARHLDDGSIEYLGRLDHQVKVRGFRIELGEIEAVLATHASVRHSVVVAREDRPGDMRLVAYVVPVSATSATESDWRTHLEGVLPEHMVPGAFVRMDALPLLPNGKTDRAALPAPARGRPDLAAAYVAPRTPVERTLAGLWESVLGMEGVGAHDSFFHLGGTSLLAVRVSTQAREQGLDVPVISFFRYQTLATLAASLSPATTPATAAVQSVGPAATGGVADAGDQIAVVGMSLRVPGADGLDQFWSNLVRGVDSITRMSDAELDRDVPASVSSDPRYVPARGILAGVDRFDAPFFGLSPREAQLMDPQQRITLELVSDALEHAGYAAGRATDRVGVFAGVNTNTYQSTILPRRPDLVAAYGAFNTSLLNEKDYVATRAAHALGLTGPALSIHTACSTGLVTVCQAVQSLRAGQCSLAVAGGVSVVVPSHSGHLYLEGGMLSVDGHTRSFDAAATGTSFGDGGAMVVLKRLSDAERDGDTIYAVIRGVGVNNDGAQKASFTAPSIDGQAAAISMALLDAGVDARSIGYVEAHGTGTPLGDPIEVEALTQVFRATTDDVGFCALGSVKSNVGHTVTAAGAVGLIKAVLTLHREQIPPTMHFTSPNPNIDFAGSPFAVAQTLRPWARGESPRRAGVSSFGVGGTNAHVVVEEAPLVEPASPDTPPEEVLVLSARSEAALAAASDRLATFLETHGDVRLADVAFTLQSGRREFEWRRSVVAATATAAVTALRAPGASSARRASSALPVAFMFPGQGAQYARMGAGLYATEPVFRAAFDRCADAMRGTMPVDLRAVLFADDDPAAAARALRETSITQPALFAIGYAMVTLWDLWGVRPAMMIGHSVGEFVAACVAGVFSLEDAARLVAARGVLLQSMEGGSMLSVRLPAAQLADRLGRTLSIASDNAPALCVVSGPTPDVARLQEQLAADGIAAQLLHTSHAFHSPMMDSAMEPFARLVRDVPLHAPSIPFVSSVTGTWITAEQACDPAYWARHLRETVQFARGAATLLAEDCVLLEAGPRGTLATLARQQPGHARDRLFLASLGDTPALEGRMMLTALGELWAAGVPVDWTARQAGTTRRRIALPSYPFQRERHWIDALASNGQNGQTLTSSPRLDLVEPLAIARSADVAVAPLPRPSTVHLEAMGTQPSSPHATLSARVAAVLEQVSGLEIGPDDADVSLMQLGFDSLALTQVAIALGRAYGVKITFRQLIEEHSTMTLLTRHLASVLPPEQGDATPATNGATHMPSAPAAVPLSWNGSPSPIAPGSGSSSAVQQLIEQQLRIMAQQLAVLSASAPEPAPLLTTGPNREIYDARKAFGAAPRITVGRTTELTPRQRARLDAFIRRYTERTRGSKAFTAANRAQMADPRVVSGFRPLTKELVYPIVVERSLGANVWDVDGNEYLDVLSGFGSNMFGWRPAFVVEAVRAQLDHGFEVGPQHPLTAEVSSLFRELTGVERVAFCNTGSEAVLGAIRIARTVTGRNLIVVFANSYHGINDEVIVRAARQHRAVPAAPGILPETAQNVLVLDYGSDEALEIIHARGAELAAVLVEPVQSRRPDLQPREFLHELRRLTTASGTALIIDEIITGFRSAPGGAQEHFGVQADLATYGKVVGGGLSIGVIGGKRQFMDALDGGHWEFGDDSTPDVGVTYFAGTFVRHPLALAAAHAVLLHLREEGPALQRRLAAHAERLQAELNEWFRSVGAPIEIRRFTSMWKTFFTTEQAHGDLLFYMLRDRGIHVADGFPCFMTAAHTDAHVTQVIAAFREAVTELQEAGFLPGTTATEAAAPVAAADAPPVPGARLGRDREGRPAWFVSDPDRAGGYRQVEMTQRPAVQSP